MSIDVGGWPDKRELKCSIRHLNVSLDCETAAVNGSLVPYIIQESQKFIMKKKIID
jgi:hypothetical protein